MAFPHTISTKGCEIERSQAQTKKIIEVLLKTSHVFIYITLLNLAACVGDWIVLAHSGRPGVQTNQKDSF